MSLIEGLQQQLDSTPDSDYKQQYLLRKQINNLTTAVNFGIWFHSSTLEDEAKYISTFMGE